MHSNVALSVFVYATDRFLAEGIRAVLERLPQVSLTDDPDGASVAIVAADRIDDDFHRTVGAVQRDGRPAVVALVGQIDDEELLDSASAGISAVVRRAAGPESLVAAVFAAARGEATFPPDLLARLLSQVAASRKGGSIVVDAHRPTLVQDREVHVLRLLAEGLDTAEIASQLNYSERTIKGIIHDLTTRLHLKNRSHAVAYAVKAGLI